MGKKGTFHDRQESAEANVREYESGQQSSRQSLDISALACIWATSAFIAVLLTSLKTTIALSGVCDSSILKDVVLFTGLTLGMPLNNLLIQAYDQSFLPKILFSSIAHHQSCI